MELKIVEVIIYTGIGLILLIAAVMLGRNPNRKSKVNIGLMIYAGILFLLGALLTLVGGIDFGKAESKMSWFDLYGRLLGAAVFLYLAVTQYRKKPKSKRWLGFLVIAIAFALVAIFHI